MRSETRTYTAPDSGRGVYIGTYYGDVPGNLWKKRVLAHGVFDDRECDRVVEMSVHHDLIGVTMSAQIRVTWRELGYGEYQIIGVPLDCWLRSCRNIKSLRNSSRVQWGPVYVTDPIPREYAGNSDHWPSRPRPHSDW